MNRWWVLAILVLLLLAMPVIAQKKVPPGQQKFQQPSPEPTTIITTTAPSTTQTSSDGTNWEMIGALVAIIAALTAGIGWYVTNKKKSKTSGYLGEINTTYNKFKNDSSKCEANLYVLRERIEKDFTSGKIDEHNLGLLHGRIERYLKNVRMGIVDDLDISADAKKELSKMLKDGIVSEEEYTSFVKHKDLSSKDKSSVEKYLAKWKRKDQK